jgi:hypothetical protein
MTEMGGVSMGGFMTEAHVYIKTGGSLTESE